MYQVTVPLGTFLAHSDSCADVKEGLYNHLASLSPSYTLISAGWKPELCSSSKIVVGKTILMNKYTANSLASSYTWGNVQTVSAITPVNATDYNNLFSTTIYWILVIYLTSWCAGVIIKMVKNW